MVVGAALGLAAATTIALSAALAFAFGYSLTMLPLLRHGLGLKPALRLALAADTASIAVMEVVDNLIMVVIPGAMDAGLGSPLFWGSLVASLLSAGAMAFPLNWWLVRRGQGHAPIQRLPSLTRVGPARGGQPIGHHIRTIGHPAELTRG